MQAGLQVESVAPDIRVVRLIGDHDLTTAVAVYRALDPETIGEGRVLIDLTATNFVDSTVLGLIFDLVRAGDTADGAARVAVVAVPGSAADRIITLSGWTRFVNAVHETKEHALRALRTER